MSYRPRDEGVYLCLRLAFYVPFPLMGKEPKDQGQNHRPCTRPPKRLTFKSGSAFRECKRKRPSLKVKRLVVPWATAAPRFGRARAPIPVSLWRSHTRCPLFSLPCLTTHPRPQTLIAGPDLRSPTPPEDYTPCRRFAHWLRRIFDLRGRTTKQSRW